MGPPSLGGIGGTRGVVPGRGEGICQRRSGGICRLSLWNIYAPAETTLSAKWGQTWGIFSLRVTIWETAMSWGCVLTSVRSLPRCDIWGALQSSKISREGREGKWQICMGASLASPRASYRMRVQIGSLIRLHEREMQTRLAGCAKSSSVALELEMRVGDSQPAKDAAVFPSPVCVCYKVSP